jgi:hypothetical protein
MDRINHVKIVSPKPEAIDRFLREVVHIPAEVGGIVFEVMMAQTAS